MAHRRWATLILLGLGIVLIVVALLDLVKPVGLCLALGVGLVVIWAMEPRLASIEVTLQGIKLQLEQIREALTVHPPTVRNPPRVFPPGIEQDDPE